MGRLNMNCSMICVWLVSGKARYRVNNDTSKTMKRHGINSIPGKLNVGSLAKFEWPIFTAALNGGLKLSPVYRPQNLWLSGQWP